MFLTAVFMLAVNVVNVDPCVTSSVNHFSVTMTHTSVTVSDPTLRIGPSSAASKTLGLLYTLLFICLSSTSEKEIKKKVMCLI